MTIDEFWNILDGVHAASGGDMKRKCGLIREELGKLSPEEMRSFCGYYGDFYYRAYNWDIWGAIVLICGGCGDDSFMDFRHTMISMGREFTERVFRDPDSLAELDFTGVNLRFEGFQYAVSKAYDDVMQRHGASGRWQDYPRPPHPEKPAGEPIDDWDMERRWPRLAKKYGHKDSKHTWKKEKEDRRFRDLEYAIRAAGRTEIRKGRLSQLMLESGMVHESGWFPPWKVLARVLREGRFADGGRETTWQQYEFNEGDYWNAVSELRRLPPEQIAKRPELQGKELKQDIKTPVTDDFAAWVVSLKERGV